MGTVIEIPIIDNVKMQVTGSENGVCTTHSAVIKVMTSQAM